MSSAISAPIAYGYLRVGTDGTGEQVRRLEDGIRAYAEHRGLALRGIYRETGSGLRLDRMASTVQGAGATHVILPSLEQITNHLAIQAAVIALLHVVGARLHLLDRAREVGHG
ncbi:recombinase family protein [Streptomyces sp. 184]|uniref:recombinase family protein n=1 Tax=Streptomyces sp. 184 TaxID=1827526 RepID=UPI0038923654